MKLKLQDLIGDTWEIISEHQYSLNEEQQRVINKEFNKKDVDLLEMTKRIFEDTDLTRQGDEYNNVRKYISKIQRLISGKITWIELNEQDMEFIKANAANMSPKEMAQAIYPSKEIRPLSKETQTVDQYCKALDLSDVNYGDDSVTKDYVPPKADSKVVYLINASDPIASYNANDMRADQKQAVERVRGFLNSPIFMATINTIRRKSHRDLFEKAFVQTIYDRADVSASELNLYITLCSDYVMLNQVQEQLEMINAEIDRVMGDDDNATLKMAFVEAYTSKSNEYNQCKNRIEKYTKTLEGSRATRMTAQGVQSQSLVRLVEMWKATDEREGMRRVVEAKNLELKDEVERIKDVSELVASVWGVSEDEIFGI